MAVTWYRHTHNTAEITKLATDLKCQRAVAATLINRGFSDLERAQAFLHPTLSQIRSPFLMRDMDKAVSRIVQAIVQREKIYIFGDYDVDGVAATALLANFLDRLDSPVSYHIPDRFTEGYGLSPEAIEKYAAPCGASLIITVDCGTTSHEAVCAANRHGMDVIITDHHETPPLLPEALAVVNPKRSDCPSHFTHLAGVGVTFNLALALRKHLRDMGFWKVAGEPNLKAACDLVALGTVADMVPLLDENRIFVKAGLEVMTSDPRPGLKALLEVCGAKNRTVDTWDLAFRLAPRLNAAGRLGSGEIGCQLLTTIRDDKASVLSEELDRKNTARKHIESQILEDISRRIDADPRATTNCVVLESHKWHEGVIGIVASRLVNQYMRPVVLIALRDGMGKGSARSPEGINLFRALESCSQHLEKFGGHAAAAGLSLKEDNIPAFRKDFEAVIRRHLDRHDVVSSLPIDMQIRPDEICPALLDDIERLAPFGMGNPEPLFSISDLDVVGAHSVGDSHLKMRLVPAGARKLGPLEAIIFNADHRCNTKRFRSIACNLRWNTWRDTKRMQLVIKDFVPS